MAVISGHGGSIVQDPGGTPTTFHIGQWTLNKTSEQAVVTTSAAGGARKRIHILRDWTATIELPLDADVIPETDLTFEEGDSVTVDFNLGASGKFYRGLGLVAGVSAVNNNDADACRVTININGNGLITQPVT